MNPLWVILLSALGAASAMHLGYQKEKRYTYSYQTDAVEAIPLEAKKSLGLRIKCQVHIDVIKKTEMQATLDNCQVRQVQKDSKREQETAADHEAAMNEALAKSVSFTLKPQDGSIKELKAHPQDHEWSLNIKRGLVNLFQISYQEDKQAKNGIQYTTQQEDTAVGECQVAYAINKDNNQAANKEQIVKVTKVMNYEKCSKRAEFLQSNYYGQQCQECQQSMGYAPYHRSAGEIEYTLTGSEEAGYVIKIAEAYEQHVITPLSQSAGQVTVTTRQTLQLQNESAMGQTSLELTRKTSQVFTAESHEKRAREDTQRQKQISEQAEKYVNEMCKAAQDPASQQAAEKFVAAVQQLRRCDEDTLLRQAKKMLARQDPTERQFCLDALSFVGTKESFQVLKKMVEENEIGHSDELKRVFLGLASAPRPTADHIDAAWKMCEKVREDSSSRRQCLLSLGALIYKVNQQPSHHKDTKTVTDVRVKEMVKELDKSETSEEDKLTLIKVLGNAGSPEAREKLQKILKEREEPLHTRVECVWALRRIVRQAKEKTYQCLISIFADPKECPELRMATFAQLLNTEPNFATLQALTNIVKREINDPQPGPRSNQVASFVISHLSALAYQNNVLTKKRSMQARMALRLLPEMNFGLSYSKGMRFAQHSEKFQAGFEFEANKIDLPESMLPRNLNARLQVNLFGFKTNPLEFGARIENMDDVVDDIISQVRDRHKRSIWGSALSSWFSEEQSDDNKKTTKPPTQASDGHSTRASSRPTSQSRASSRPTSRSRASSRPTSQSRASSRPTSQSRASSRPTSQPIRPSRRPTRPPPASQASDGQPKQRHMSAFLKWYGNEVKFMEVKQDVVDQLARDVSDVLLGKKDRVEYTDQGITISKNGVEIKQTLEKAILDTSAQRMLPTLAGISLDMQFRSAAAVRVTANAKLNVNPSLRNFWQYQSVGGNFEIKPSINAHAHAIVGLYTPFLRVGVQMKANANTNANHKAEVQTEAGKSFNFKYSLPQGEKDILHFKATTHGFSQQQDPKTDEQKEQLISLDLISDHLSQFKTCAGQDMFGVHLCAEGQGPDLPSLRLQQVPVLSAISQAELRVSMKPAKDNPASIQWSHNIPKNDDKEKQIVGEIVASSDKVTRRIPCSLTYKREQRQLEIECTSIEVKGYEDATMKVTANGDGVRLEFGRKEKRQYQITVSGQIGNQGESLQAQAKWTEIPEDWKKLFQEWEPQIWYALQQFGWIKRTDQQEKNQVSFECQLTSPITASVTVKTPDAEACRTGLSLPLRVDHFPRSYQDIKNYLYAKCEVQDQKIEVFDHLRYQHNIKGGCPYVLTQEHREGKQSRFQLAVKIDEQGQKTLLASIEQQPQQSKETVEIRPHSTILIDGQEEECAQVCQCKQGGCTVRKVKTPDGKTEIQLSTKLGLHVTCEDQRIQVYASPFLRDRVRGLCGDANGEEWNEFKDPQEQVQTLQNFIHSWQKC